MSEDREKLVEPSIDEITCCLDRFTLFFAQLGKLDELMKTFVFFKYPRLSIFWCCLLVIFIMMFDPSYLLSYLLSFVITLFTLQMPMVAKNLDPYLNRVFFDHPNIYYKPDLRIATSSQRSLIETKQRLLEKHTPSNE